MFGILFCRSLCSGDISECFFEKVTEFGINKISNLQL